MKRLLAALLLCFALSFCFGLPAQAATVTITTTAGDDARLAPAYGDLLHLGRNATTAEVKAWLIQQMQAVVQGYEYEQQRKAIAPAAFTPN